jgi:hypothetical protein
MDWNPPAAIEPTRGTQINVIPTLGAALLMALKSE